MKNTFKLGFLALAISLSVAACSSDKKAMGTSDSSAVDSAASTGTSTTTTTDTTTKTDTTAKTDTTTKTP
ncbi:MAG: hypothetical protein EOP42_14920 [Sphingobacteriaceae bacterium]|nr:MAG: hypothetical protein EOP42_14920 [Sphingobacteriaceae bacterium]